MPLYLSSFEAGGKKGTPEFRGSSISNDELHPAESELYRLDPVRGGDPGGDDDQDHEQSQHGENAEDHGLVILEEQVLGRQERTGTGNGAEQDFHRQGSGGSHHHGRRGDRVLRDRGAPGDPDAEGSFYLGQREVMHPECMEAVQRACQRGGDWACNGGDPYGAPGYRLPTDAEWEYATQWDDERIYPWGDGTPDCDRANCIFYRRDHCVGCPPVGSYPDAPAALGPLGMARNVGSGAMTGMYAIWGRPR